MQVTPVKRPFGKHKPGEVFNLPDKTAKVLILIGRLQEVGDADAQPSSRTRRTYQRRDMHPEE